MAKSREIRPVHILLVDDDPLIRILGRELLENLGYRVEIAGDGAEVLEQCARGQVPDLVILDFHLPVSSGLEVVQRLRASHPEVRVLVASGFFSAQEVAELREMGAAGFLHKPFRVSELRSRIEEILGGPAGT